MYGSIVYEDIYFTKFFNDFLNDIIAIFFIIVIAWINYINLSTATSSQKVKEIGIRKVVGASKSGLVLQVLTESSLFNVLSVIIAL